MKLTDSLRAVGIHVGYPEAREVLAAELYKNGPPPRHSQLQLMIRHYERIRFRNPAAAVAKKLNDGSWRALADDLEFQEDQKHDQFNTR